MVRNTLKIGAVVGMVGCVSSAMAITFFDGIFNNPDWSLTHITNASGVGSSQVGFQVLTGGNPNEYRRIRNQLVVGSAGNGASTGIHLNNTAFYNPSAGAITSINYSEDSINFVPTQPGNGQGSGLAIFQSGRYYIQRTPTLVMPGATFSTWQPNPAPGLVASDLWEISLTGILTSSSNPDFSTSGGVMQFGFWRGNSANQNINTECGIDNWSVTLVPSPGSLALVGMGGVAAMRRRRL